MNAFPLHIERPSYIDWAATFLNSTITDASYLTMVYFVVFQFAVMYKCNFTPRLIAAELPLVLV